MRIKQVKGFPGIEFQGVVNRGFCPRESARDQLTSLPMTCRRAFPALHIGPAHCTGHFANVTVPVLHDEYLIYCVCVEITYRFAQRMRGQSMTTRLTVAADIVFMKSPFRSFCDLRASTCSFTPRSIPYGGSHRPGVTWHPVELHAVPPCQTALVSAAPTPQATL